MGYWPTYAGLTSPQRRIYVEWLCGGRATPPPSVGYVFLFMYGLERRALAEESTGDISLIFDEILRLRSLYGNGTGLMNRSFDGYTASFLWFFAMKFPEQIGDHRFRAWCDRYDGDRHREWGADDLAALLSWFAIDEKPLPEWAAYVLAAQLSKSPRNVVTRRVAGHLRELFSRRFSVQFPGGIELRASERQKRYPYRPASAALPAYAIDRPHPMGLASQFAALTTLWNTSVADLRRLSSLVKDDVGGKLTIAAWEAMPAELRDDIDHPLTRPFIGFVQHHVTDDGEVRCTAAELATLCGVEGARERITPGQSRWIAELSEYAGYSVEPDARLTGRGYEPEQPLAMFERSIVGTFDPQRYAAAACLLAAGLAIAHADGCAGKNEVAVLSQQLRSMFELTAEEQRRLDAQRSLLLAEGIDIVDAAKRLKQLPDEQREIAARLIVGRVVADGTVSKEELKAVRKFYGSMGFSREHINETLASLKLAQQVRGAADKDDPVTIAAAVPGGLGEAIPPPLDGTVPIEGVRLDRDAIAAIMRETHEVARLLADAMGAHHEPLAGSDVVALASEQAATPAAAAPMTITAAPADAKVSAHISSRYAAFYQLLLTKPSWRRQELLELAKRFGLMLSGAVDAINDWSNETNGGPLLYEDGDVYTLETAYLN